MKSIYQKINLYERYKSLSEKFDYSSEEFQVSNDILLSYLKENSFSEAKYISKEKYFNIEDYKTNKITPRCSLGLNIIIKYNEVDFVVSIIIDGEGGNGGPFGAICQEMGYVERIKRPYFKNENDLLQILEEGFIIYNDIKKELQSTVS